MRCTTPCLGQNHDRELRYRSQPVGDRGLLLGSTLGGPSEPYGDRRPGGLNDGPDRTLHLSGNGNRQPAHTHGLTLPSVLLK